MKQELKVYRCNICGNIIVKVIDSGVDPFCCGQKMELLKANTTDGAHEKHVPVVTVNGNAMKVQVGSVAHPMVPEHYIQWILVETEKGFMVHELHPNEEPQAVFLVDEPVVAVYEYCNLHGLWKVEG